MARLISALLISSFLLSTSLNANEPSNAKGGHSNPAIKFDHARGQDRSYTRYFDDGELFSIRIDNTCEIAFSYEVRGILIEEPDSITQADAVQKHSRGMLTDLPSLKPKTLDVRHDQSYGGYIVNMVKLVESPLCQESSELESRTLMIHTPRRNWNVAFSGGFVVSGLTNPVYALRPHPTEPGKSQIVEDPGKRDTASLGIATFVHMYHERRPRFGIMFGLGLQESDQTEYYIGGGLRLSDRATINLGLSLGPVSRLPGGIDIMEPIADNNILTNLPTRVQESWFFGISFSFINVGDDRLRRPFAGSHESP